MTRPTTLHRRGRAPGFSLIELMVALLIGLLVVAGLISVLTANRQAFSLQQSNNVNQENSRFAMSRLAWSIRMADFWGGVKPDSITGTTNVAGVGGAGACTGAWVLSVGPGKENGLRGYDGADTFPISNCVDNANYVKRSDVIVLRYADTHGYDPAKGAGNVAFDSTATGAVPNRTTAFIVAAIGDKGTLFRSGDTVPSNALGSNAGRYVYPVQFEMYYLRPCADPGADGVCGTADDGDASDRQPTLVRMRMDTTGALASEAVIEGIEQLQFEYASPAGGGVAATPFQKASVANFNTVTQVRATVVARAATRDVTVPHTVDYRLSGHCAYAIDATGAISYATLAATNNCASAPASNYGDRPQQYYRLLMSQVILVRNRVRS
jgi:type IV pilus assembly protein PilW